MPKLSLNQMLIIALLVVGGIVIAAIVSDYCGNVQVEISLNRIQGQANSENTCSN